MKLRYRYKCLPYKATKKRSQDNPYKYLSTADWSQTERWNNTSEDAGGDNGGRQIIPDKNSVTKERGLVARWGAKWELQRVPSTQGRHRAGARQHWKIILRRAGGPIPFTSFHSADRQWSLRRQDRVGSSAARKTCGWLRSQRRTMAFATLSCSFWQGKLPENGVTALFASGRTNAMKNRQMKKGSAGTRASGKDG